MAQKLSWKAQHLRLSRESQASGGTPRESNFALESKNRAQEWSLPRSALPFIREEAYAWIRDRILRGEFTFGDPLHRRKLAARLRMSLLPVSGALHKLEIEGLVEIQRRTRSGAVPHEKERDRNLAHVIHAYHDEFHQRIVDGARCGALRRLLEEKQVLTLHWPYGSRHRQCGPLDSHTALARVIAGRDPDKAAAAMREHVVRGSRHLLAGLQSLHNQGAADKRQFSGRCWRAMPGRPSPPLSDMTTIRFRSRRSACGKQDLLPMLRMRALHDEAPDDCARPGTRLSLAIITARAGRHVNWHVTPGSAQPPYTLEPGVLRHCVRDGRAHQTDHGFWLRLRRAVLA